MTSSTEFIYALIIAFIIIILYNWYKTPKLIHIKFGSDKFYLVADFENREDASKLLHKLNQDILSLLHKLKIKYHINETDEYHNNCEVQIDPYLQSIVEYLLKNHNSEVWQETDPRSGKETSYNIGKGSKLSICLRNKTAPDDFHEYNDIMFVVLHEISHTASYMAQGHPESFWEVFRFILWEASNFGLYKPVDYANNPVNYCGLVISYSPLFDKTMKKIYEDT